MQNVKAGKSPPVPGIRIVHENPCDTLDTSLWNIRLIGLAVLIASVHNAAPFRLCPGLV